MYMVNNRLRKATRPNRISVSKTQSEDKNEKENCSNSFIRRYGS